MSLFLFSIGFMASLLFLVYKASRPEDKADTNGKVFGLFIVLLIVANTLFYSSLEVYAFRNPRMIVSLLIFPPFLLAANWKKYQAARQLSDFIEEPNKVIGGAFFAIVYLCWELAKHSFPDLYNKGGSPLLLALVVLGIFFIAFSKLIPKQFSWPILGAVLAFVCFLLVLNFVYAFG